MNAKEIKEKRKKLGLTQKKLAELLGISTQTLNGYENGKEIPSTKYQILESVLNNYESNILNETKEEYHKELPCKKELEQVKNELKMAKRVIELLEDKSKILQDQVILLENDIKNGKTD